MIHGKYAVKGRILAASKEIVGLIGAENLHAGIGKGLNGRNNDFGFLLTRALGGAVGIERHHGNART